MKPFAIWLAIVAVVFGGYALVSSSLQETSRVFVFVDASNPMAPVWRDVPRELDRLDDRDDAEFALARGQSRGSQLIHSWQPELRWSIVEPFAPCSFTDIESFTEATDADDRILITTADSCDTSALVDWEIILLEP
ncbi:MAG TPA: hypothetical protein VLN74_17625 [Ilumatobacteraceae bacterium]|nr:hypothetical protein [Ilumatobacteraceae bacterium]